METRRGRRKDAIVVREFVLNNADIWFLRFSLSSDLKRIAVDNKIGQLFLWNVDETPEEYIEKGVVHHECAAAMRLTHNKMIRTIRQTAFGPDGNVLVCCCDDGTV